ncbi:MAG: DMT family transporter [Tissierellia bacterium]|nr:DMT family transporter [Tissierellia bacterium]
MDNRKMESKKMTAANLGLLFMAIVWGFGFIVTKDSIDIVTPMQIMVIRFAIGAVGLFVVFMPRVLKSSKDTIKSGAILGVLVFVSYTLQTIGIKYTSASNNAFLTTIYVIIMPWLVFFTTRQKPGKVTIIASVVTFIGVGLMSIQDEFSINYGDILTVLGALVFGLHLLRVSIYSRNYDPIALATIQLAVCAVLSIISTLIFDPPMSLDLFKSSAKWAILYLGIVNTFLTFLLQFICQKYTTPISASLIMSLESVFAAVFSYLFLDERLAIQAIIGAALILISIFIAQLDILKGVKADERALYKTELDIN